MPFNRLCGLMRVALVLLVLVMVTGCKDSVPDGDEVFDGARQRVTNNVLPDIKRESGAVLRNLTNLLAALPQICATPLAKLGVFDSVLPAGRPGSGADAGTLGPPDSVTLIGDDDEDTDEGIFFNSWELIWNNVILGDLRADTETPPVDITLNVRYRTSQFSTLSGIPFILVPPSAPLATATVGEPPSLEAGTTDRFFLYQDGPTGVWVLRWRAVDTTKVFSGTISFTSFSRVIRRVSEAPQDVVESLELRDSVGQIEFVETTTPTEDKGFTFYAKPGDRIRFQLNIGPNEGDLESITSNQLRIGAGDQQLPVSEDPGDFQLATNVPLEPSTAQPPAFTLDGKPRTFVWQDVENTNNFCNLDEADPWRIEFRTTGNLTTTFTGEVTAREDDTSAELTFESFGNCDDDREDGGRTLDYTCTLQGTQTAGYDICVTRGHRVLFNPSVNDLADPGLVFIGAEQETPLTSDPFDIFFDVDLVEPQSDRHLTFTDILRLNPDQVSLEPLCGRLPEEIEAIVRPQVAATFAPDEELVQPRVRLNGSGEYSTDRFDGSLDTLEEIEFLDKAVETLDAPQRFPDRGLITLQTRVEDEVENSVITSEMDEIEGDGDVTQALIDLDISISRVIFEFDNEVIALAVE
jgi:hypothetical protein